MMIAIPTKTEPITVRIPFVGGPDELSYVILTNGNIAATYSHRITESECATWRNAKVLSVAGFVTVHCDTSQVQYRSKAGRKWHDKPMF